VAIYISDDDTLEVKTTRDSAERVVRVARKLLEIENIPYESVADLMANTYRDQSPWIKCSVTDLEGGLLELHTEDDGVKRLSFSIIIAGYYEAQDQAPQALCCLEAMVEDDIALGCAQDVDTILQYAMFHELRYG